MVNRAAGTGWRESADLGWRSADSRAACDAVGARLLCKARGSIGRRLKARLLAEATDLLPKADLVPVNGDGASRSGADAGRVAGAVGGWRNDRRRAR